jgi:hypothetical protein
MTSTKDLFQSKKPLLQWWIRTTDDPQFAEVLLHARSEFIESGPTEAELKGARLYEIILTTLAEAGPSDMPIPSPGLLHHPDEMPPRPSAPEAPPKPQPKQQKRKNEAATPH